jgi:hypothetical protein
MQIFMIAVKTCLKLNQNIFENVACFYHQFCTFVNNYNFDQTSDFHTLH